MSAAERVERCLRLENNCVLWVNMSGRAPVRPSMLDVEDWNGTERALLAVPVSAKEHWRQQQVPGAGAGWAVEAPFPTSPPPMKWQHFQDSCLHSQHIPPPW